MPDGVGVREVGHSVRAERDVGVRVVHHAVAAARCWRRRSCARGRGCGRSHARRAGAGAASTICSMGSVCGVMDLPDDIRREQRFRDQVVLASAQRAERDVALDDLAGARVGDGFAVAPAAGVAMHPLDDVVAHVHRVGAGGQQVDAEGALGPARGLEGRVPPARAFEQRRADRLRRAAIHVVLDGRDRLAVRLAVGVFLDEPVAQDELLVERLAQRRVVVAP